MNQNDNNPSNNQENLHFTIQKEPQNEEQSNQSIDLNIPQQDQNINQDLSISPEQPVNQNTNVESDQEMASILKGQPLVQIKEQPQPLGTDPVEPPKKKKIGLIIGIIGGVLVLIIIIVLLIIKFGSGNPLSSNIKDGKIPYYEEKSKCAVSHVKYKDETRDLCYQEPLHKGNDSLRYLNFSFYLSPDEKNVLSFKLDKNTEEFYSLMEMGLDLDKTGYVYTFQTKEEDTLVVISNRSLKKYNTLDLSNKETVKTSDNKELYKGTYATNYTAYQYYVDIDGIEAAITVVNRNYKVDDAYNRINKFIKKLSKDSGAPFIVDYVITRNTMGFEKEGASTYSIKDYKYVIGLEYNQTTGSLVNGNTGLNFILKNNEVIYKYSEVYLFVTKDNTKYSTYRTKMNSGTATYGMWSAYIPEDKIFSNVIDVWNGASITKRFGYITENPDEAKGAKYYIDSFKEMIIDQDGKPVGETEQYQG